ncbi:MAG TPA: AMP-binding protein [Accumulibacter sp.]|nr:AMP-binding protein [Accumulibacter sp.]HMW16576.1 AMP-binding protein [Accumulibacter sp.]HMX22739.1 AMP-binding protein [Accumulibacter sp.]HNC17493.1 AMP-binding protein [Accumulibacter sp.]HND79161.1 AMP-binding protein [Accumulibacter sp.]
MSLRRQSQDVPPGSADSSADAEQVLRQVLQVVGTLVAEMRPGRQTDIRPNSQLGRDLGLDSLARVELLLRLGSEFGKSLPEAALTDAQTPLDLWRHLVAADHSSALRLMPEIVQADRLQSLPDDATTLVEVIEWHAGRHPDRPHVLLYGENQSGEFGQTLTLSYGELLTLARRLATGLVSRGLTPRQTVALMLPTSRDYLVGFFAVLLAGGIPLPIYPPARLTQIDDHLRRHARILRNAEASLLITVPQGKATAAMLRAEVSTLREVLTCAELDAEPIELLYRCTAEDLAFLQYTSGSTGDPKGVMLSHANLLANLRAMGEAIEVGSDDVFVSWLPLYHDMGLIGAWFGSLYFGMRLVLMSPFSFLTRPARWLQMISQHRATISAAPNFAYEMCANKVSDADLAEVRLSSWRLALNGAEPVSPATLDVFARRYAPYGLATEAITPVYGLAECSVGLAFPPLQRGPRIDWIDRQALAGRQTAQPVSGDINGAVAVPSCGRVLPRHRLRIVDDNDLPLGERQIGRLQFQGPSATTGYYRNQEATQALFHGDWLDSGDFAYLFDGEIYLTGRVKDLIIRGGRKLYPYELEKAVGTLPGIRQGCVAVFASADRFGVAERLVVAAETRESDPTIRQQLRQQINQLALAVVDSPVDEVVLAPLNAVLKTSSGKIRRNAMRELFESGRLVDTATPPGQAPRLRLALATARGWLVNTGRLLGGYLYAGWCWTVLLIIGLPIAGLIILLGSLITHHLAHHLVHHAARWALALTGLRVDVSRSANRPLLPDQSHLLLVNHCSYLDGLVLCAALPPAGRHRFVAKREFVEQPLIHRFLQALGTLFVERFVATKGAEDVAEIVAALQRGDKIVLFPEGTFSREAGLKPFRMGAFVAAARAGVPVVVAGLRGTRQVLRDQNWLPRHGKISLTIGAVLSPTGNDWQAAVALRDATRREMLRLSGEHDLDR